MAETPPDRFLVSPTWGDRWGEFTSVGIGKLSIPKQRKGYNVGEAPGAQHLNYLINRIDGWQQFLIETLAAKAVFRNMDATFTDSGGSTTADSMHIDYDALGDHWYSTGVMSNGTTFARDSVDGETWSSAVYTATPGVGSTGDATKFVTDGTVCAWACDNSTQAKVYTSSDLTVANLDTGTNVGTSTTAVESSDLVYDAGNNLWIWCGRSTTRGNIWTASDPTGTWTLRKTFTTDTDAIALATDGAGNSVCSGATETYYSSNGTTWTLATVDAPVANNITWAPSLNLFVCRENSTGDLWTSTNGDTWRDQNAINGVPTVHNIMRGPEFVLAFGTVATSTNGVNYAPVYVFHTEAVDADSFNYQTLGEVWGEALPVFSAAYGTYTGGQGKLVYPYTDTGTSSDTRPMVCRYGPQG